MSSKLDVLIKAVNYVESMEQPPPNIEFSPSPSSCSSSAASSPSSASSSTTASPTSSASTVQLNVGNLFCSEDTDHVQSQFIENNGNNSTSLIVTNGHHQIHSRGDYHPVDCVGQNSSTPNVGNVVEEPYTNGRSQATNSYKKLSSSSSNNHHIQSDHSEHYPTTTNILPQQQLSTPLSPTPPPPQRSTFNENNNNNTTTTSKMNNTILRNSPDDNQMNYSFLSNNSSNNSNISSSICNNNAVISSNQIQVQQQQQQHSQFRKRTIPSTPPPIPSKREFCESRTRSVSMTAHVYNNNIYNLTINGGTLKASDLMLDPSSSSPTMPSSSSSSNSSTLNLSLNGANNILGNPNHINMSPTALAQSPLVTTVTSLQAAANGLNNGGCGGGQLLFNPLQYPGHGLSGHPAASSRRRTTSTNSNGAGTREVHNQLEKYRRAHLKECFSTLKNQLELKDDEKKKTSNLAILDEALKQVKILKQESQEKEQIKEELAKIKIIKSNKISTLNREMLRNNDNDINIIPVERGVSESDLVSLSPRPNGGSVYRYRSSNSVSSIGNPSSLPLGANVVPITSNNISPVISSASSTSCAKSSISLSPNSLSKSPLHHHHHLQQYQTNSSPSLIATVPTTSTPSSTINGYSLKLSNIPSGVKIPTNANNNTNHHLNLSSSMEHSAGTVAATDMPLNLNASQQLFPQISSTAMTNRTNSSNTPKDLSHYSSNSVSINNGSNSSSNGGGNLKNGLSRKAATALTIISGTNTDTGDSGNICGPKVIKVFNNKLATVAGGGNILVSPFIKVSSSSSAMQHQTHSVTPSAQLQKLLVSGNQSQQQVRNNGNINAVTVATTTSSSSGVAGAAPNNELGRLPGGAELNILPTATQTTVNCTTTPTTTYFHRANGKIATVNSNTNGISLKGEATSNGRGIHVVNSLQNLGSIVVPQGQQQATQLIAASNQLAGKANLSVGGKCLPLMNATQYLSGSVKPMVVVASIANPPTLTSVPPTQTTTTSANIAAATGTTTNVSAS